MLELWLQMANRYWHKVLRAEANVLLHFRFVVVYTYRQRREPPRTLRMGQCSRLDVHHISASQ